MVLSLRVRVMCCASPWSALLLLRTAPVQVGWMCSPQMCAHVGEESLARTRLECWFSLLLCSSLVAAGLCALLSFFSASGTLAWSSWASLSHEMKPPVKELFFVHASASPCPWGLGAKAEIRNLVQGPPPRPSLSFT